MISAEDVDWLERVASSRAASHSAGALVVGTSADRIPIAKFRLPVAHTQSSKAMITLLLQQFTAGSAGSSASLLEKSVAVRVREEEHQHMVVEFQNTGPVRLSEQELAAIARRFEVYLDYHAKLCKSAFHTLTRQFYTDFQHKLAACEYKAFNAYE